MEGIKVPVPKPRRHILVDNEMNNKASYENVSIDLINKNFDIKNENLQNNSKTKLPLNKQFLIPSASGVAAPVDNLHMVNVLTEMNDLQSSKDNNKNLTSTLDEVNNLNSIYNDDNTMDDIDRKPVPAPRRSASVKCDNRTVGPSTGAISKMKSASNLSPTKERFDNSKCSGSYSLVGESSDSVDSSNSKFNLRKTYSNSSLSSSQSSSSNVDNSARYHTTSPGQLLKTLGATSRLLTESITERVTSRTKDAKHKIDKIQKNSRDRLAETTKSATNKFKTVRKSLHDTLEMTQNLSLGRNHRSKSGKKTSSISPSSKSTGAYDFDRPQTLPDNDDLFQSITFNSPLNCRTNNCTNINNAESSYEIPKSLRSISSNSTDDRDSIAATQAPPSYDEIMKADAAAEASSSSDGMPRPTMRKKSKEAEMRNAYENHNIRKQLRNDLAVDSSEEENKYSVPCPNYPAPVLDDSIYGKLRSQLPVETSTPIQPPIRSKRRKDVEQDKEVLDDVDSNRATIGSNDLAVLDSAEKLKEILPREVSEDFSEKLRLDEAACPKPDRSESWSYYTNSDGESSPEPIYANEISNSCNESTIAEVEEEPVYGVLYNADSPNAPLLQPKAAERKRRSASKETDKVVYASVKKEANIRPAEVKCSMDILKEFDPLDRKTLDKFFSNKSNELILIENLLGEETYGTCNEENQFDYTSLETSEDDDDTEIPLPSPPERLDSLQETANENDETEVICRDESTAGKDEQRKTVIVHQNANLKSDSGDELEVSQTSIDDSKPSKSRWFLPSSSDSMKSKKGDGDDSSNSSGATIERRGSKTSMKSMFSNVMNKVEGIKRKTSFRSNSSNNAMANGNGKSETRTVLEMVPRPCLTQRLILHEGHLIRLPNRQDILKELHSRKAFIRDRRFQAYCDKDMKQPKENIPLEWITTIQCVSDHKFSNNFVDIYSFEITTTIPKSTNGDSLTNPNILVTSNDSGNTKMQRVCHMYGVAKESERFIWMQKILESITEVFPPGFSSRYYRAGWCYSKNSITSKWAGAWLLLQKDKRRLLFYNYQDMSLEFMDLRKARCLVLKESDDSIKNLHVESGPMLMVDCPPYAMYFVMSSPRETKIWRHLLQEVAHNNGPSLKEQQLTKDNVPVLVDKCINFIYAHGSMSEGIYRKSGSENSIQKLLNVFRTDAFSVQIIRNDYSEHDVANALKRFMRDLPDRLLGRCTTSLIAVSEMKDTREKIKAYKELLSRLQPIENHTLKKLLGHLHFIQTLKGSNKMDVGNLAIVWGPTLLLNRMSENAYSQSEADVVIDLIKFYKNLFSLSADEVAKEQIMLSVLQKYHAAAENLSNTSNKSGDLMVWITIDANPEQENEEKPQIHIKLTPNKTVHDICKELAPKMKREAHTLTLSELILNGALRRPLHHSEKVFDIVLKWSYWPEDDRKNNYLLLRPMKFMRDVERALKMLPTVTLNKELKFVDSKTKSFKLYTVELNDGKVTILKKEKNTIVKVKEIDLAKTTAYLGCEKKRDFQLRWAITLIEENSAMNKNNLRTRETPYFGHVIAGTEANDQIVWFASILHSLHGDNILPSPEIIIP